MRKGREGYLDAGGTSVCRMHLEQGNRGTPAVSREIDLPPPEAAGDLEAPCDRTREVGQALGFSVQLCCGGRKGCGLSSPGLLNRKGEGMHILAGGLWWLWCCCWGIQYGSVLKLKLQSE